MFHIFNVADRGVRLSTGNGQAVVKRNENCVASVPFEELDAIVIEEPAVSLTGIFLAEAAERKIPVILCGRTHQPQAICSPVFHNTGEYRTMLALQMQAKKPWKKQLWKKIIRMKISGQSALLEEVKGYSLVKDLLRCVRSGDTENAEARAAAVYWKELNLFPVRGRFEKDRNCFFNYAYAILYAAAARAVCAAGLEPDIGIHHHNKYNPFCLASDLMEPYRPIADRCVLKWIDGHPDSETLQHDSRKGLLRLIYDCKVTLGKKKFMLLDAVNETAHSYKKCLKNAVCDLLIPEKI